MTMFKTNGLFDVYTLQSGEWLLLAGSVDWDLARLYTASLTFCRVVSL